MSEPPVTPTVTSAPARSRWSKVPAHLGRARTSTVVLGVLFLAIGTLYLNIRPETVATTTVEIGDQQPAQTTEPAAPTTAETTTPAPATTAPEPTTAEETTPTDEPTGTITPDEPTESGLPTTTRPPGPASPSTSVVPPG